jgi:hypothetical protein
MAAILAIALAAATLGAAAATTGSSAPQVAEPSAHVPAVVVREGTAPNARAAALVGYTGEFVRQKGFRKVTKPLTGTCCLKLVSTIDEDTLVASVTAEASWSVETSVAAEWDASHNNCPLKGDWVEVNTFEDTQSGVWSPADEGF